MTQRDSGPPNPDGASTGRVIRKAYRAAPRAVLVGRSVRTLLSPSDGLGDASVTVAQIAPGRMNAHRHGPGGEVMFVPRGRGILWVEGRPVELLAGSAVVAPEGLLHNAENTGRTPLVVVGAFCPAVVAGSYAEEPPRFAPTAATVDTAGLARRARATRAGAHPSAVASETLVEVGERSPNIALRLLSVPPAGWVTLRSGASTRAWVVVRGSGRVVLPPSVVGRLACFDLVAARAGGTLQAEAGADGMALVEFEAEARRR